MISPISRALSATAALLLAGSLAACGIYSPVSPDTAETRSAEDRTDAGDDRDAQKGEAQDGDGDPEDDADASPTPVSPPQQSGPAPVQPDAGGTVDTSDPAEAWGTDDNGRGEAQPGEPPSRPGEAPGGPQAPPPILNTYAFALPASDTSVNTFQDGPIYGYIAGDQCARAADHFRLNSGTAPPTPYLITNPRMLFLLLAGIEMCQGRAEVARDRYASAISYGVSGLDRVGHPNVPDIDDADLVPISPPSKRGYGEPECDMFRALTAALSPVDRDSLSCPGGAGPGFSGLIYEKQRANCTPSSYDSCLDEIWIYDDPLTPQDDSATCPQSWLPEQCPSGGGWSTRHIPSPTAAPSRGDVEDEFGGDDPDDAPTPAADYAAQVSAVETAARAAAGLPPVATPSPDATPTSVSSDGGTPAETATDELSAPDGIEIALTAVGEAVAPDPDDLHSEEK